MKIQKKSLFFLVALFQVPAKSRSDQISRGKKCGSIQKPTGKVRYDCLNIQKIFQTECEIRPKKKSCGLTGGCSEDKTVKWAKGYFSYNSSYSSSSFFKFSFSLIFLFSFFLSLFIFLFIFLFFPFFFSFSFFSFLSFPFPFFFYKSFKKKSHILV